MLQIGMAQFPNIKIQYLCTNLKFLAESCLSPYIIVDVLSVALDAPTDLLAVSQTDNSISLEWTNSKADVGSYRVKYSPISGATHGEEVFPRSPGDTTKATIIGKGRVD